MKPSLEIFQTLGALVGFASGAYALYDRLLRYRPFVSIYADLEGSNAWPFLRINNAAPYDIFISKIEIAPPLISLSQQNTARAMADVMTKAKITASIKVGDSALFHIIETPSNADEAKRTSERIRLKVYWHRSMPSIIRPIAAAISTSIEDIEERKRAAVRAGRRVG